MRVLSGIQPTGRFHWGNYFGAIRQYIDLQDRPDTSFYFIANLHALTTVRDAERTAAGYVLDAALDLLALGLDPEPGHALRAVRRARGLPSSCWLLMTGAPMGLLERCLAYKDKKAKGLPADAGLFTYPVLMAADILIYDSDIVPVGEDQVQHIEVARDLAGSFNHEFGETFVLPKAEGAGHFGPRARHRRREDVEELRQHAGGFRGAQGAAEADHADRDRLAPAGAAEGARRRSSFRALFALCHRRAARGDGRHVSPRRLRLRRGEEGAGRNVGRAILPPRGSVARSLARIPQRVREILGDGAADRTEEGGGGAFEGGESVRAEAIGI